MNSVHILPLKDAYIKFSHHYTCILNHKHSALEGIASVLLAVHQRGIQGRQVISNCCGEACGVKVSRQSGSVHSTHSVQSALYCKSLLINLMPLAELHSRLESVTKKKETVPKHAAHGRDCVRASDQNFFHKLVPLHSCGFVREDFRLCSIT